MRVATLQSMSDRILLAGLAGFAGGILCRSLFFFSWHVMVLALMASAALVLISLMRRSFLYLVAAAFLFGAGLGVVRVLIEPDGPSQDLASKIGTEVTFSAKVDDEPDLRETMQRIRVRTDSGERVLVVAPLYPSVDVGDEIDVTGTLQRPEPFATDGGRVFRYDRFLAKDHVFVSVERASIEKASSSTLLVDRIQVLLLSTKDAFQAGLANALPEPYAALASGLITGGKQGLGKGLLDAFVLSGLVHIVVLSGYNVMIVAEAVMRSLGFLSRRGAAIAAGAVIGLFVLIAGAGAASVRAGLMAGLALTARATGRTYAVLRALAFAGFVMLLVNPLILAFDPGFQLSFIATLGLVLGAPIISAALGFVKSAFWRELLASTLAAQIAVLPLLLYQTGLLSFVSVPANLLVLPLVPLAMLLSAIAGAVGFIIPVLGPVVGLPALIVLSYIVYVAQTLAELPLASVTVPQFPFMLVILAYAGLVYWIAKAPAKPVRLAGALDA